MSNKNHNDDDIDEFNDDEQENNSDIENNEEDYENSINDQQENNQIKDEIDPTNPLDEDSNEAAQNLTQEDVFGEELSDLSEDEERIKRKNEINKSLNRNQNEFDDEELIEENEQEEEEEEPIIVDTPNVQCDLGKDIHLIKLPTFMKIEPKPFDLQYFNEEIRDEDDEESKARKKLQIENTIRWRFNTNEIGETIRESNTRLIRWSDGSLSLHVGKEIFDVSKANIQSDHNHLFVRHQKSMQAQALFRTKLSFRQHSNDSLAHLKLKFASKANPAPKVRVLSNIKEHMKNSDERRKKEEQQMKTEERRRNQQMRQREKAAYRNRKISASYLEDREEEDEDNEKESLNAIKQKVKKKKLLGGYHVENTSEEEEDEDDDDQDYNDKSNQNKSSNSTKHRKVDYSDDEENSNEDFINKKKTSESDENEEDNQD